MLKSNPIIEAFLAEARAICEKKPFVGSPNNAMFWAHIDGLSKSRGPALSSVRNSFLCSIYSSSSNARSYQISDMNDFERVERFFKRYAGDYPPEITDQGWSVFSKSFAEQAQGDHAYVAVNDALEKDWFITAELPILKDKFKCVTSLEPAIDNDRVLSIRATKWNVEDWLEAQQAQWKRPFHYLDGTPYPSALVIA